METPAGILLMALLFAPGPPAQDAEGPLAPDGKPGLGIERTAREYAELLRDPEPDEARMVAALRGLEDQIAARVAELEPVYRADGTFELLERREPRTVEQLHARFRELAADPLAALGAKGKQGEAFARAWLDARFRLRLEVLAGAEREARDLRAGLTLIGGMNDGYVDLRDVEAQEAARRIDLSAALLRAARLDLEALRPAGADAPGRPEAAWVVELLGVARERDPELQRARLEDLRRKLEGRMARLRQGLFSPRLRETAAPALARRAAGEEEARRRLRELLPLVPDSEEGRQAPPEIQELSKLQRYGTALRIAVEGLAYDVLNADLCYWAGLSADFFRTRLESRAWFDRFLALRGIRSHDDKSYRPKYIGRELTEHETYALSIVQQAGPLGR